MVEIHWSRRNAGRGEYQNLIFIGDMSLAEFGYGFYSCPRDNYYVVLYGELQRLANDIKVDRRHIEKTIEEELVFPIYREIDKLENEQLTSSGLTKEVKRLLEILPKPSLN